MLNKAAVHEGKESYPDYWRAKQYYLAAQGAYRNVATPTHTAAIDQGLANCEKALASFKATDVLPQLVAKIAERCAEQNPEEAGLYYGEAQRIAAQLENANALSDALKADLGTSLDGCQDAGQIAEASTARTTTPAEGTPAADQQSRSITPSAPSASEGTAVGEAVGDLQQLSNSEENSDAATPQTSRTIPEGTPTTSSPTATRSAADASSTTATPVKPKASFLAERAPAPTTNPVARTRGMDDSDPSVAAPTGTPEQMKALEKGKTLFDKSRKSGSTYEAQKAFEYLTQAGTARDGEANYMLGILCHTGDGTLQDDPLALALAKESALQGYAGGHYLYASLLLLNENKVDSVTAKKSLNVAATKGFPAATDKLLQLRNSLTARLRN